MRIIITGSRGFIGESVGRYAHKNGHQVLGISRSRQPMDAWMVDHVQADVAYADLTKTIDDFAPDLIFHGAGTSSVKNSISAPTDDLRAAAMTWMNTLEAVRLSSYNPVIVFPSSAAVYGNPISLPVKETDKVSPISPYGFHKFICEIIAEEYAKCFGLNIFVARIFSLFGILQRRLLLWELYEQMSNKSEIVWIQGTGKESRDYLYIDDFCQLILSVPGNVDWKTDIGSSLVCNVGSGKEIRVLELAEKLSVILKCGKEIRCRGESATGDPQRWVSDTSLINEIVKPWITYPIDRGLEDCIKAWNEKL